MLITTKFLCPTDTKGSRVKAAGQQYSMTFTWDCALDSPMNHYSAAYIYGNRHGFRLIDVEEAYNGGYVFTSVPSSPEDTIWDTYKPTPRLLNLAEDYRRRMRLVNAA